MSSCLLNLVYGTENLIQKLNDFDVKKSSIEFYKVVNRFFQKIELRKVLDTFLEVIQNPLNKFEKFEKMS